MKTFCNLLLSIMLMLIACTVAYAQSPIRGDMDCDNKITIVDVAWLVDVLQGKSHPVSSYESLVEGTWSIAGGTSIVLNDDGTCTYGTATKFAYNPFDEMLYFYDSTGRLVEVLRVLKRTDEYILLIAPGTSSEPIMCYGSSYKFVTSITLNKTSLELIEGNNGTLTTTIVPSDATDTSITWTSSNTSVAKVSSTGVVTAVAEGTATISAKANGSVGLTATCAVTVKDPHDYVDLGLTVKWATCNVGATNPQDYGLYFAWGETTGYTSTATHTFNSSNYKWYDSANNKYTKYFNTTTYSVKGTIDNRSVLESADDAATVKWGSKWRMPTHAELSDLYNKCTWSWTTQSGVKGYKVTGPNGNYIFLPATGFRTDKTVYQTGTKGFYWSRSLYTVSPDKAYEIDFTSSNIYPDDSGGRDRGYTIRPVRAVK